MGEKRGLEKVRKKLKGEREREKSDLIESLPRIARSRKLKPTIQVSCKPKLDRAQGSNCGGAQIP